VSTALVSLAPVGLVGLLFAARSVAGWCRTRHAAAVLATPTIANPAAPTEAEIDAYRRGA
jgi:hypothetical protein